MPPTPSRQVRVFLSSTFRDMQAEREALIRKAFPQLRRHCLERGAQLAVVDLRWGITREQAQQGKVVGICLDLVEACRPFFVGLLGQRYGWIPGRLRPAVLERHPWIPERSGWSLTEMEIRHGALDHEPGDVRARFYLRDPRYLEGMTADERALHLDDAPSSREKLERLRREVVESDHPATGYFDPDDLSDAVLSDLKALLEGTLSGAPTPRERRPILHIEIMGDPSGTRRVQRERFEYWRVRNGVVDRAFRDLWVDERHRLEDLARLSSGRKRTVACVGPPGIGKSRTLCELRRSVARAVEPPVVVSCHSAEMPVSSAIPYITWAVGRAIGDDAWHGLEAGVDDLAATLEHASRRRGVLVTIDHVDEDATPTLERLSGALPPGCTLVVAARSDAALPGAWDVLELPPPSPGEVRDYCRRYFADHGKTLSEHQLDRLADAAPFPTFGALADTTDELRTFGRFEELDAVIDAFASATSAAELYEEIVDRLLGDLGPEDGARLLDLLGAVAVEPGGRLADGDAADFLGLPLLEWMELRTLCQPLFEEEATYAVELRDEVARIARRRLEADDGARRAIHARLARVFEENVERTAYHLREAGLVDELEQLLHDLATAVRLGEALDTHWPTLPEAVQRRLLGGFASQVRAAVGRHSFYTDLLMLEAFLERQDLANAPLRVEDVLSLGGGPPRSHHAVTIVAVCSALWRAEATLPVIRDLLARDDLPVLRGVPDPRAFWLWLAAVAETRLGNGAEGQRRARQAVEILVEDTSDPRLMADAASHLGTVAFGRDETDPAVAELLERALAGPAFQDPGERERRLEVTRQAAWIYCNGGDHGRGLRLFRRLRNDLGPDGDPSAVARARVGEAHASAQLGRTGRARAMAREALEIGSGVDGSPDLPELAAVFADLVHSTGDHDPASIAALEGVLERDELAGSEQVLSRVRVAHALAFALWRAHGEGRGGAASDSRGDAAGDAHGDLRRARDLFQETRAVLDREAHPLWCGEAWAGEGYTWMGEARWTEALESMECAIPLLAAAGAEGRASWTVARLRRADILSRLGRHDEADRASARLVEELGSTDLPEGVELRAVLRARAEILSRAGREEEAAAARRVARERASSAERGGREEPSPGRTP